MVMYNENLMHRLFNLSSFFVIILLFCVSILSLAPIVYAADPMFAGTDGALVINGTTVTIAPSTKFYSSVSITNGGILNIVGDGSWMIIGSAGDFVVDATSKIQYKGVGTTTSNSTGSSTIAPDGVSLVYLASYSDGAMGDGGGVLCGVMDYLSDPNDPLSTGDGKCGGNSLFGNGGGGAAFDYADGGDATLTQGGNGASGSIGIHGLCIGGAGGTISSKNGADGEDCIVSAPYYTNGAGGGGGFRGDNGGAIYIKVGGTATVAGTIDVSGSNGGDGGIGGDATDEPAAYGGGGGGGGDGGDGGMIRLRYVDGTISGTLNVLNGLGGNGADGGVAFSENNAVYGDTGNPGVNGSSGTVNQSTLSIPSVTTALPTNVTDVSVTLNSSITADGGTSITNRGFAYGLTTAYGATTTESSSSLGSFSAAISGLTCGTTYHWRAYATNAAGMRVVDGNTFTTSDCSVPETPASSVSRSGSRTRLSSAAPTSPTNDQTKDCPTGYICTSHDVSKDISMPHFEKNLRFGDIGDDVRRLQMYLNSKGYFVAVSGNGSVGNESIYFGYLTRAALSAFQKDHGIPATGYFGPITRAYVDSGILPVP